MSTRARGTSNARVYNRQILLADIFSYQSFAIETKDQQQTPRTRFRAR